MTGQLYPVNCKLAYSNYPRERRNPKILSGQSLSWPRFKLDTCRTQIRNATVSENLLPVWEEVNTAYLRVPSQDLRSEQNHCTQVRRMRTSLFCGIKQLAVVNFLPTFRDNLSVLSSRVKILTLKHRLSRVKILTLEYRTDRLSRNVGNEVHYSLCNNRQERSSHLLRGGNLKSRRQACYRYASLLE